MKKLYIILFTCLFAIPALAQTKAEIKASRKLFEGNWSNKKLQRHLSIFFDAEDYATINDWHGKWSQDNNTIDAYKAFIQHDKLVMPEDKTDLRSPYCEIVRKGNTLLYRCRSMFGKGKRFVDEVIFTREK